MRGPIAWSLELGTVGLLKAGSASLPLLARLPANTKIYLPALPTDPPSAIEEALGLIKQHDLEPIPHIAASREESISSLEKRLAAWQRASKDRVREVLVVRGDPRAHHGTESTATASTSNTGAAFGTSLELLESNVLQRCGIEAVSLCGHPEGIAAANLSAEAAQKHLKAKLQWADASGVRARVVTQFCFDTATATGYVDTLRADGLDVAVSIGIVGPDVSMDRRKKMAERCGVRPPENGFVTPSLRRLARWQAERGELAGAQMLHLYPFGGLRKCLAKMHDFTNDDSVEKDGTPYANFAMMPPVPDAFASGDVPAP